MITPRQEIIYGIRPVIEAIEAGKEIDRVFIKKGLQGELFPTLMTLLRDYEVPSQFVPIEKLNRITMKNHQGVVAYTSPIEYQNIEKMVPGWFEEGIVPLVLILDGVTDVRNFGAIARTASCAGVNAIIIPDKGAAQVNEDAMKTSAGALQTIAVSRVKSLEKTAAFLKNSGFVVVGATEKAVNSYFNVDLKSPLAIVIGAEDTGISSALLRECHELVKIPLSGPVSSLNVSVATGIIVFEAVKQRLAM